MEDIELDTDPASSGFTHRPTATSQSTRNSTGYTGQKKRTPKHYADSITAHATRSAHDHLFPGTHYHSLSRFLQPATYQTLKVSPNRKYSFIRRTHDFAVLHDLAYTQDDPRYMTSFDSVNGPQNLAAHTFPHDHSGQLLFLRGWPSPEWINTIGARYRVEPEIFRRHLEYGPTYEAFDLPGLPSASVNIIKLSTSTLGDGQVLAVDREQEMTAVQSHFNALGSDPAVVGESVVRRLWIHDKKHFSIEQFVFICVIRKGDGWVGESYSGAKQPLAKRLTDCS